MQAAVTVTPAQIPELLLGLATVRPVFLWGAPGIGKSSLVRRFAESLGLECVSLLGTQLAPEDLIGVPQIRDGRSVFCPPEIIARDEPYCLFLDELNAATPDVQKAFYSLILDRRIGSYELPMRLDRHRGGQPCHGQRAGEAHRVRSGQPAHPRPSAGIGSGLAGLGGGERHPSLGDGLPHRPSGPPVVAAAQDRGAVLHAPLLAHALRRTALLRVAAIDEQTLKVIVHGTLTPAHAVSFCGYAKIVRHTFGIEAILKGDASWSARLEDRDLLYYLAEAFRGRLVKELPRQKEHVSASMRQTSYRAKSLLVQLAEISVEVAQTVIADDADGLPVLPAWFLIDAARDMPRLVEARR